MKYSMTTETVTLSKRCTVTNKMYSVVLRTDDYLAWQNGGLIQKVFPNLEGNYRVFITTGWTPAEYQKKAAELEETKK